MLCAELFSLKLSYINAGCSTYPVKARRAKWAYKDLVSFGLNGQHKTRRNTPIHDYKQARV